MKLSLFFTLFLFSQLAISAICDNNALLTVYAHNRPQHKNVSLCVISERSVYAEQCSKKCQAKIKAKEKPLKFSWNKQIGSPGHKTCYEAHGKPIISEITYSKEKKKIATTLCWYDDGSFATVDLIKLWGTDSRE